MARFIRLSDRTHEILGSLRNGMGTRSYDDAIRKLIAKSGEFSGFGKDRGFPRWREDEDRARFRVE